jgi:hypothetical protein
MGYLERSKKEGKAGRKSGSEGAAAKGNIERGTTLESHLFSPTCMGKFRVMEGEWTE